MCCPLRQTDSLHSAEVFQSHGCDVSTKGVKPHCDQHSYFMAWETNTEVKFVGRVCRDCVFCAAAAVQLHLLVDDGLRQRAKQAYLISIILQLTRPLQCFVSFFVMQRVAHAIA